MQCYKCKNKATINILHLRPVCSNCFITIIEKRIRKYIRINKLIRKNDRLIIKDPLCLYFIKKIIKSPIKIVKNNGKEVLPWTLDDECNLFLKLFFNKNFNMSEIAKGAHSGTLVQRKPAISEHAQKHGYLRVSEANSLTTTCFSMGAVFDIKKIKNNNIKLFKTVTDEELIEFSKIRNIKYKTLNKDRDIEDLLNNLSKYPEIKFSLLKCINNIKKIEELK